MEAVAPTLGIPLGPELLIEHVQATKAVLVPALQTWSPPAALVLDCSALQQLDGAGLQLLVLLALTVQDRGGQLQLRACSRALRQRIETAALAAWFTFDAPEAA